MWIGEVYIFFICGSIDGYLKYNENAIADVIHKLSCDFKASNWFLYNSFNV